MYATTIVEFQDSAKFPSFNKNAIQPLRRFTNYSDKTTVTTPNLDSSQTQALVDEVRWNFNFAYSTWKELDYSQLYSAFAEAILLARSGLFEAEFIPDICVDEYGEFTFSHQSEAGYVDIGVRGKRELSYHVRNDIDPSKSEYDDLTWNDYSTPIRLYRAIAALREHL